MWHHLKVLFSENINKEMEMRLRSIAQTLLTSVVAS